MRLSIAATITMLCLSMTAADASEGWTLEQIGGLCGLSKTREEQEIMVVHGYPPGDPNGDYFQFSFRSPALQPALAVRQEEVLLIFKETEGPNAMQVRVESKKSPFDRLSISTIAPGDLLLRDGFEAISVEVTTSNASDTFDVTGLSGSLAELRDCARSAKN